MAVCNKNAVYSYSSKLTHSKLDGNNDKNNISDFGIEIGKDLTKEGGKFEGDLKIPKN